MLSHIDIIPMFTNAKSQEIGVVSAESGNQVLNAARRECQRPSGQIAAAYRASTKALSQLILHAI